MGVMGCYRENCENIMCDTYIAGVGYVCYECKDEFREVMGEGSLEERQIDNELKKFMNTPKGRCSKELMSIDDYFYKNS